MIKRIIIAGSRNYNDYEEASAFIDSCLVEIRKKYTIIIISGGSRGADAIGEQYAIANGFNIEKYPADWKRYAEARGLYGTSKWQKSAILLYAFGTEKAREQNL